MKGHSYYPKNTATVLRFGKIIKKLKEEKKDLSERLSTRLVRGAAVLPEGEFMGWQLYTPVTGIVDMGLFCSDGVNREDLEWMAEKTVQITDNISPYSEKDLEGLPELYEVYLPVRDKEQGGSIGFFSAENDKAGEEFGNGWPTSYSAQFAELIGAFRVAGACFRAVLGPATMEESMACRKAFLNTADLRRIDADEYLGKPVKTRFLLRLSGKPSIRLLSVLEEAIPATELRYLGNMKSQKVSKIWDDPLADGIVLPDYATRILILEPSAKKTVIGIENCEEPVEKIPAGHDETKDTRAVTIGRAVGSDGLERNITIGELDLRRHYEIVGQTGTGKSTLLANIVLSAIEQGFGLTFFDPHGSTIDVILRSVPSEYADRIRVVRIGDAEHPVPLSIWDTDDIEKEERNISDLCELFADIFDPNKHGIVGPRYERWLSTFAKASIAFLGKRASLESITVMSQSKDNMLKFCKYLHREYPYLVETIKEEYGKDNSNDFQSLLNWCLAKFQRITSVEQLRKTLGAGVNALDLNHTIDTNTVDLIDLASPIIGTHAARVVGSLMLMKLWNATMTRQHRERTRLVLVDEASLFQTNPMPRMLAEARKFGLAMVLCHQHEAQLTQEVRDALEANSANFSAFRLSPRDAGIAAVRFDDDSLINDLTRLDAFNAITTISVDGRQTAPFTLEIQKPQTSDRPEETAERIEADSIKKLVTPYSDMRALTVKELQGIINHCDEFSPEEYIRRIRSGLPVDEKGSKQKNEILPNWLTKWNDYYVSKDDEK